MAYDTEVLYQQAVAILDANKQLVFVEDLAAALGVNKTTFYRHFPKERDEFNALKDLLRRNKAFTKMRLRKNWLHEDAPASVQIALYKLLADPDELQRLSHHRPPVEPEEQQVIRIENYIPLKGGINEQSA